MYTLCRSCEKLIVLRARDHCCVLCDVARDRLFIWYLSCTSRPETVESRRIFVQIRTASLVWSKIWCLWIFSFASSHFHFSLSYLSPAWYDSLFFFPPTYFPLISDGFPPSSFLSHLFTKLSEAKIRRSRYKLVNHVTNNAVIRKKISKVFPFSLKFWSKDLPSLNLVYYKKLIFIVKP